MSVEVSCLEKLPSSKMTSDLIAAAKVLNKHVYDMFVKCYMRAREKLQMTNKYDDKSKLQIICVRCIDYTNSKPRVFNTSFERCKCGTSVAFEAQCEHEIKVRDGFYVSYFQKRHMRRNQVKGSLNGWSLKKDTTISGEIFNVQEDIDNTDIATVHADDQGNDDVEDKNDYPMDDNCDEHIDEFDDQHIDTINDQEEATVHVGAAMKSLTLSNLKELFNNVTSNYSQCSEETRFIIGALSVNLSKLSISEGNGVCEEVATDMVMDIHKKCILQYQSAFCSRRGAFVSKHNVSRNVVKPSNNVTKKQSKERLKRQKEQAICNMKKNRHQNNLLLCPQTKRLEWVCTWYIHKSSFTLVLNAGTEIEE